MEWYGIAFGVFSGVSGFVLVSDGLRRGWRNTVGQRRLARRKVERLSTTVTEEWFRSILGTPATARSSGDLTELIWIDPFYYVQAIVDGPGQVVQWAVTSREPGFQPEFGKPWRGPFTVRLNSTPFASICDHDPEGLDVMHGARRTSYTECQYFGNPGGYQRFAFAVTDAAPASGGDAVYRLISSKDSFVAAPLSDAEVFALEARRVAAPNTYAETTPNGQWTQAFGIGVDLDHIRVVPDPRPGRLSVLWSKVVEARRRLRRGQPAGELEAPPALDAGNGGDSDEPATESAAST